MKNRCFLSFVALLLIIGTTTITAQKQISVTDVETIVCPNTQVQLLAPQGALSYLWTPSQNLSAPDVYNPITTITEKTTFEVTCLYETTENLVRNGDFEQGNTGFVSRYTYKRPNGGMTLWDEGCYTVTKNARSVHRNWDNVYDHTSGNGNYLIANGHTVPNFVIWEQTIRVESNHDYIFQAYAVNLSENPPQLQFSIEGVQLGNVFTLQGRNQWQHFYVVWNSGSYNGDITIRLLNQRTDPSGNDFGVDDISFRKLEKRIESITIDVLDINKTLTETACDRYEWHGVVYTESGTYVHNYENDLGCASTETLELTINKGTHTTLTETACDRYEWHGVVYTESGTYVHNYENDLGCTSTETLVLKVDKLDYQVDYELIDCKERIYRFISKNVGNTTNDELEWKFSNGVVVSDYVAEVKLQEGTQEAIFVATTENGCVKEFRIELTVSAYFNDYNIEVEPALITPGKSTVRMYTIYRPNVDYDWNFGDGSHGFDSDVVHTYNVQDESYYDVVLTVTDTENCVEERSIRILVDKTIDVPNTFTPNGDGYNDLFLNGWHIKIFDRKGFLIYEGNKGWDGTYMNKMVPDDTYFYIIDHTENGQKVTKKGYITVIK